MRSQRLKAALALLLMVSALPVFAQTESPQDGGVSLRQLRQLRSETEGNRALADDLRAQILEIYQVAISSLETAADHRTSAAAFERERAGVDRLVRNLRADLERPERRPRIELPAKPTVEQAEDALARERARLAANRSALRNRERHAEDRAKSRTDISQRLGELDLQLELLDEELRTQADSTARSELKVAASVNIRARREAILSEVEMLRARLSLLADRSVLIPMEIDLAQRRVSSSEELVGMLEGKVHGLRTEEAQESLGRIRDQSRKLSEEVPAFAQLATETEELAEALWAPDGFITRSESTVKALAATRRHQSQLNRIAELTSRKFEAYGGRGSIKRWWPKIPRDFPKPGAIAGTIQHLEEEIPEVEHRLITFEQQRSAAHDLARRTMLDLETELGAELDPELAQRVRELLAARQDLLDLLIQQLGSYSNQLVEYRAVSENFLSQLQDVEHFLFAHILWSRSVPKPIIPRLRNMTDAVGWLTSAEHLRAASIVGFVFRGNGLFAALLLIVIVLTRQPMRRRLSEIARRVSDQEKDALRFTTEALALTGLLAAPLPVALYIAGTVLQHIGDSAYFFSSAAAMFKLAVVAALFELVRQVFAPDGLAEAHFGWPTRATGPLHRGLLLTEALGLPLLYVALHLAFAGIRLDSPSDLQLYNNSLGRVAFIAALAIFGLSILTMLRPEKRLEPSDRDVRVPWPRRFSEYAFPTAFLGAYPMVILATIVPALLAALGFYITGLLLAYQMLRTLLLALVVMVGGGLVHRWRIVNRKRDLLESEPGEVADEEKRRQEFEATEKQVRHLLRFFIVAVLSIGLFTIWSDALPMLQMLKRVQILPRIELLEPVDDTAAALGKVATQSTTAAPSETGAATAAPPIPGTGAANQLSGVSPTPESPPLTLWLLLEAMLAGLVTLVLVRNLPGIIEIVLKRRTTLDGGARFAVSTLVRYSITIVGTIAVFGLLGVTWGKVQWLAAALTFGLGFGLQEIVANFVSGLILLVERPVRVGDVVTIGSLMGRVTRIQIRATTITLWDRSEMIVPNKEFITTKLVNWTLSDSKRRIEIPLRVAYGADLDEVRKTLTEIAERHPAVLDDPAPHCLLLGFGDDAIKFELRFVVDFGQGLATKDQVQMSISQAFREKGIEFALPKSEVRLIGGAEADSGAEGN
ncbi:MAG: mechanosensitive ion channel domain-containing protein [Thermoanaerobaculales bacterium]